MADKDAPEPSLELPSWGFGRKRRKKDDPSAESAPAPPESAPAPLEPAPAPPERAPAPPEPAPVTAETAPVTAETTPAPPEPAPVTAETAPVTAETTPAPPETAPVSAARRPARRGTATPTPVGSGSTAAQAPEGPRTQPLVSDEVGEPDGRSEQTDAADGEGASSGRRVSLPSVGGLAASLITGALVGILTVGLTWAGFRLCEVVQGTSSCGDPGFLLLLAIMIAMGMLGGMLLRAWDVPEPGSTSFLAVALLSVVALLFLVDALFSSWMIVVIPLVAMAAFALAHRVTTAATEHVDH